VNECVLNVSFSPWVKAATQRSSQNGVSGTPTVLVNGTKWDAQNVAFEDLIASETAKLES